jgi:subtilisin family serine protease
MSGSIRGTSGVGRRGRCGVAAATAVVALAIGATAQASPRDQRAPLHAAESGGIAHQYIVVLKGRLPSHPTKRSERKAKAADRRVAASVNAKPRFLYDADIRGFEAHLTRAQLRHLRHHPRVKYVEQDARVKELATQTSAPWNLVRIDQRGVYDGSNRNYNYSSTGQGVHVYILDTGLQANHQDFGGRASHGYDAFGGKGLDENGHGTHVAGTVAGTKYGVAKETKLVGVKVLNKQGSGTTAGVIAGVNWVTAHHVADQSVANMSLGGGKSQALNDAVTEMIDSGVFVSVAAGNNNQNACDFSPASTPTAFTTAASDVNDKKATFSNWGPCVDAYAPGVAITSDWIGSPTAIHTISGTSMAAPAVAGVAALYLSGHASTPAGASTWILDHATTGAISNNPADTPNRLLYMAGL